MNHAFHLKSMSDFLAKSNFILPSEKTCLLYNLTKSHKSLLSHLGIPLNFFIDAHLNQGSPKRVKLADQTEQTNELISSEKHDHRTVQTLKILLTSVSDEQSEHLLFGFWWTLI